MPADAAAAAAPSPHAPADLMAAVRQVVAEAVAQPELLDLAAVLSLTSQSRSSWYRAVSSGEAPASVATPSGPRWRRKDVMRWVEKLK